jgi:hypothetical protein
MRLYIQHEVQVDFQINLVLLIHRAGIISDVAASFLSSNSLTSQQYSLAAAWIDEFRPRFKPFGVIRSCLLGWPISARMQWELVAWGVVEVGG